MIRRTQYKLFSGMTGALCLLACSGLAHAQITVDPTVTSLGNGFYHYDYAITNNTADDLLILDIQVLPGLGVVSGVAAPTGFISAYDSGLGLVSFLEDTSVFTATPTSGFVYDSALAPLPSSFGANTLSTITNGLPPISGPTLAAVPEPGLFALIGAIGSMSVFALRRRRSHGTQTTSVSD